MANRSAPRTTNPTSNPWTVVKSKKIYDNPWISVREDQVLNPKSEAGIYGVIQFKNIAVGVVALQNDSKGRECILLVGQYRYPLDRYSWEIPEGGCPIGERPLAAAKRELKEETGFRARSWDKALELDLSNSVTDERAIVYVARDLVGGKSSPEPTEVLELKSVLLTEALRMVLDGEITDAISAAAILRVSLGGRLGR